MPLLVGLGNPGPTYRQHRHNVGFRVLERLHERVGASEWRDKYAGLACKGVVSGRECALLKPGTFMNLSGRSVQKAMAQLGVPVGEVIVVHDDLDLALGDVRVKVGGGHGGHNGLRDISGLVGADYVRVRVGIGRPIVGSVEDFVLSPFRPDERPVIDAAIEQAAEAMEGLVGEGPARVMNKTNARPKKA